MSVKTLVVDNFRGTLTNYQFGDINSGRGYVQVNSGSNPFLKPGQLTWSKTPTQIDPTGSTITDLIMAGSERVENGILYVYAIGHTGRLYKIQVNDPATYNPDYDHPVLITTLSLNSPTFTRGGFMDFYGATERIYIGHDKGVTTIDFDGSNETFVGTLGSWTQNVPRPFGEFTGKLYVGNGTNLAEIDSTGTVTSYSKLSPGFPDNSQVRDIDLTPDGNYLSTVVTRLPLYDITSTAQDTTSTANTDSYIFKWNGIDGTYTTFDSYPTFSINANIMFQSYEYAFGYDQYGAAVYNSNEKLLVNPETPSPQPNAIFSTGNLLGFFTPVFFDGIMSGYFQYWGSLSFEVGQPLGYWSPVFSIATAPETDILRIPLCMSVSGTGFGPDSSNYPDNKFGTSKMYFSQLESSAAPTTAYRFYKWDIDTSALQDPQNITAISEGIYQTQIQMFSKKITIKEVRIYGEPWVDGNSFEINLLGSVPATPITGGTKDFATTDSSLTVGDDFAWWNPDIVPTYAIGLQIINLGNTNHTINKIEIDYTEGGK